MNSEKNCIEFQIVDSWPKEEIVNLYKSGGWWKDTYNPSRIESLIKGSYAFCIAIEKKSGKAIGMGRIISDGISDAYLQDIVILKKYRKQGIGKKLVKYLIDYCKSKGIIWLLLIAEPNQDSFYKLLGFKKMENYVPMKYRREE